MPAHLALLNRKLMQVAASVVSGSGMRLMIFMPPRHGKSMFASRFFPAWFLCNFPQMRVMLASYEAEFAATWGLRVREAVTEAALRELFPVRLAPGNAAASGWGLQEHVGGRWRTTEGGMHTAGVGGALTGRGFNLGIIDDPVKNSEQAQSRTYREKAWDWYNSTFATRAEPGAAQLMILTRWHQDDLAGRVLANAEDPWEIISLPAIAEEDDFLGRDVGAALWPARYDEKALATMKAERGSHWWNAMYQQRPTDREGGFFKREWFTAPGRIVDAVPAKVNKRARYWDKAATEGGGDYTAGVRGCEVDGIFYIEDVKRGQWSSGTVRTEVLHTAQTDGVEVQIGMEQEPGSSGKDVKAELAKLLAGYGFHCEPSTGSKEVRADPFASQAEAGNVRLVRGPWNEAFIEELCGFPMLTNDDQVDGASGLFAMLANRRSYEVEVW